jgi:uncharacterized protein (DUF885 family)
VTIQHRKTGQAVTAHNSEPAYIDPTVRTDDAGVLQRGTDPTWSKAKQLAYISAKSDLLFTSVHEVWPGHFLQFLHSNRSKSAMGRLYVGYAYAEGWAHYAEEMMWEAGLGDGDPEVRIGMLGNALKRNARFLRPSVAHDA